MQNFNRIVRVASIAAAVLIGPLVVAQQGTTTYTGVGTAGVQVEAFPTFPDVVIKTGNNSGSAFRVFNKDNAELMRVSANGNVGIGTAVPSQKLEVFNGTTGGAAVVISTPLLGNFATNSAIGGLRLAWKYGGSSNNVDLNVVRGFDATDGAGLAIYTSPNNSSSLERMRITSAGRVGIGTTTINPTARLMVLNDVAGLATFLGQAQVVYGSNATTYDKGGQGLANLVINPGVTNSGGATGLNGTTWLQGGGALGSAYGVFGETSVYPGQAGSITNAYGLYSRVNAYNGTVAMGYGLMIENVVATNDYGIYQAGQDDTNFLAGDVVVGSTPGQAVTKLTVNGNAVVNGSITGASVFGAVYQDVAEWVPASMDMEPGTLVVLNRDRNNEVMPSSRAYDTSVAGVVSANPGIILGKPGDTKEQIATTGRVKMRVDATRAAIAVGDLLVSSDKPGTAMKSIPVELSGISMHRPGTIVGKALEPMPSGEGEILVLLSLQ